VKNLTDLLRLLILTATLGSLAACGTTSPYQSSSTRMPTVTGPGVETGIAISIIGNAYTNSRYGLDDAQKQQQNAAVYTALESDYGKVGMIELLWVM
jgi:hypothetical protein